jgi:class I fructose-bisphosphate aldolase
MNKINIEAISTKGRALYLAYDQGLEHGPTDFDDKNIDPNYIIDIAKKGKFNGLIVQKGIAEQYNQEIKKAKVPLIVKLNGRTSLLKIEPYSPPLCSVAEAVDLGAKAVGYTIYVGSKHEARMFKEFEVIQEQAHEYGLPVIAWMYPRGEAVKDENDKNLLAYAARIGLELGADMLKMKYNGNINDLKWIMKSAGKTKILIAGGQKQDEASLLKEIKQLIDAGVYGIAIGRNVWQHNDPLEITKKIKKIVFK